MSKMLVLLQRENEGSDKADCLSDVIERLLMDRSTGLARQCRMMKLS